MQELLNRYFQPLWDYRRDNEPEHQPLWQYREEALITCQFYEKLQAEIATLAQQELAPEEAARLFIAKLILATHVPKGVSVQRQNLLCFSTLSQEEQQSLLKLASNNQQALSIFITLALRDKIGSIRKIGYQFIKGGEYKGQIDLAKLSIPISLLLKKHKFLKECAYIDLSYANFCLQKLKKNNFSGLSLRGCTLTDADLEGVQFQVSCLEYVDLTRANLATANFTGASLQLAVLVDAEAGKAIFESANFQHANLKGFKGAEAKFNHADLRGVTLISATLCTAQFEAANLDGADLTRAILTNADFTGASLLHAKLEYSKAGETVFIRANLQHANLTSATVTTANFTGASLFHAKLEDVEAGKAVFIRANLQQANLKGFKGAEAKFNHADLRGAILVNAKFSVEVQGGVQVQVGGAEFSDANLDGANLTSATLTSADFTGASLQHAVLVDAEAGKAVFIQAKLQEANLKGFKGAEAKFNHADLRGAILVNAKFSVEVQGGVQVQVGGAEFSDANLDGADLTSTYSANAKDEANFKGTNLTTANFTGASLIQAKLINVKADQAIFTWANLYKANLTNFIGPGAKFNHAYLFGAMFIEADLREADLTDATLTSVTLKKCTLGGMKLDHENSQTSLLFRAKDQQQQQDVALDELISCTLLSLKEKLGLIIREPKEFRSDGIQRYQRIYDFVQYEGRGRETVLGPELMDSAKHDSAWNNGNKPEERVCELTPDHNSWSVINDWVHATSSKISYQSSRFEVSRLLKTLHTKSLRSVWEAIKCPPSHNGEVDSITITGIKVFDNPSLWNRYQAARKRIANELGGSKVHQAAAVAWQQRLGALPVIDPVIAECLLFHGTRESVMQLITKNGFSTAHQSSGILTGFGALGKGSYFSDTFSKAASYVVCTKCEENHCKCQNQPGTKVMLLCRVLLGRTLPDKGPCKRIFIPRTHIKIPTGYLEDLTQCFFQGRTKEKGPPAGFHSVWGPYNGTVYDSHFDSDEFAVPEDQVYPWMCIFYHDNKPNLCSDAQITDTNIKVNELWEGLVKAIPETGDVIKSLKDYYVILRSTASLKRRKDALCKLEQTCRKTLQQPAVANHPLASELEYLQSEIAQEKKSLDSPEIQERAEARDHLKRWGDSFLALGEAEFELRGKCDEQARDLYVQARECYELALNNSDYSADLYYNLAIANCRLKERKKTITYLNYLLDIDPAIYEDILKKLGISRLDLTRWSLDLLQEGSHQDLPYHEAWLTRTFTDLGTFYFADQIKLQECEEYYWRIKDWDMRKKMLEFFANDNVRQKKLELHEWLLDIPRDACGTRNRYAHDRAFWVEQIKELFFKAPKDENAVKVSSIMNADNAGAKPKRWCLKPEYAAILFDADGNLLPRPKEHAEPGRCLVKPLNKDGQTIAYCKFYPQYPLRQYAADELTYLLSGYGAMTLLVKMVHPKQPGNSYPVLLSRPLGDTLLKQRQSNRQINSLNAYAFTWKVFETLLLQYEDEKDDNVVLHEDRLVSIDSDCIMPIKPIDGMNVKLNSIVLFLKEMHDPLSVNAKLAYSKLDLQSLLKKWVDKLENQSRAITGLFTSTEITDYKAGTYVGRWWYRGSGSCYNAFCDLGAAFRPEDIKKLLYRMLQLKKILERSDATWTHQKLFVELDTQLATCYEMAATKGSLPHEKFEQLPHDIKTEQVYLKYQCKLIKGSHEQLEKLEIGIFIDSGKIYCTLRNCYRLASDAHDFSKDGEVVFSVNYVNTQEPEVVVKILHKEDFIISAAQNDPIYKIIIEAHKRAIPWFTPQEIRQLSESKTLSKLTPIKSKDPFCIEDPGLISLLTPKLANPGATLLPEETNRIVDFLVNKRYVCRTASVSVSSRQYLDYFSIQALTPEQKLSTSPIKIQDSSPIKIQDSILQLHHKVQQTSDKASLISFGAADNYIKVQVFNLINWSALGDGFSKELLKVGTKIAFDELVIIDCEVLTDAMLQAILSNSPNLQHVTIINCPQVSTDLFWYLSRYCSFLLTLHLKQLPKVAYINDSIKVSYFTYMRFPSLQVLHIVECSGLELIFLPRVEQIPKLERLEIRECKKLTQIELCATQAALKYVHVEACSELQIFKVTAPLAFSNMQVLEIIKCPKLEVDNFELQVEVSKLVRYEFKDQQYYILRHNAIIMQQSEKLKIPELAQKLILILSREIRCNKIELNHESRKQIEQIITNYLSLNQEIRDIGISMLCNFLNNSRENLSEDVLPVPLGLRLGVFQFVKARNILNDIVYSTVCDSQRRLLAEVVKNRSDLVPQIMPMILKNLNAGSYEIEANALIALEEMMAVDNNLIVTLLPTLIKNLEDKKKRIRIMTAKVLSKALKNHDYLIAPIILNLIEILQHENRDVQIETILALEEIAKLHNESAMQISLMLLKHWRDKDPSIQARKLVAMARMRGELVNRVFAELGQDFDNGNLMVCGQTIAAVGEMAKTSGILVKKECVFKLYPIFSRALQDENLTVRISAVIAGLEIAKFYGDFINQELVSQILGNVYENIGNEDCQVKARALGALGEVIATHYYLLNREIIAQISPKLTIALMDKSKEIRIKAMAILETMAKVRRDLITPDSVLPGIKVVIECLEKGGDWRDITIAISALAEILKNSKNLIAEEIIAQILLLLMENLKHAHLKVRLASIIALKLAVKAYENANPVCAISNMLIENVKYGKTFYMLEVMAIFAEVIKIKNCNKDLISKFILPILFKFLRIECDIILVVAAARILLKIMKHHNGLITQDYLLYILPILRKIILVQNITKPILTTAINFMQKEFLQIFLMDYIKKNSARFSMNGSFDEEETLAFMSNFFKEELAKTFATGITQKKIFHASMFVIVDYLSDNEDSLISCISMSLLFDAISRDLFNQKTIYQISPILTDVLTNKGSRINDQRWAALLFWKIAENDSCLINEKNLSLILLVLMQILEDENSCAYHEAVIALGKLVQIQKGIITLKNISQVVSVFLKVLKQDAWYYDKFSELMGYLFVGAAGMTSYKVNAYEHILRRMGITDDVRDKHFNLYLERGRNMLARKMSATALIELIKVYKNLITDEVKSQIFIVLFNELGKSYVHDDPDFLLELSEIYRLNFLDLLSPNLSFFTPMLQQQIRIFGEENPVLPDEIVIRIMEEAVKTPKDAQCIARVSKSWYGLFKRMNLITASRSPRTKQPAVTAEPPAICAASNAPTCYTYEFEGFNKWLSLIKYCADDERRNAFGLAPYAVKFDVGDCLFAAIAAYDSQNRTAADMRVLAVGRIRKDEELKARITALAGYKNTAMKLSTGKEVIYASSEEYACHMEQPQTWGTEIELVALARELNRPIGILTPNANYVWLIEEAEYAENDPIFVEYQGNNHYVPLETPQNSKETLMRIREALAAEREKPPMASLMIAQRARENLMATKEVASSDIPIVVIDQTRGNLCV